jgi:hypothetical protein
MLARYEKFNWRLVLSTELQWHRFRVLLKLHSESASSIVGAAQELLFNFARSNSAHELSEAAEQ